jgi:chorismate mutase
VELSDLTHYARVSDRADAIVVPDTTAVDRELVIELAIDAAARHLPVILRVPSGRPFADTVALVDSVLGEKDIGNHLIIIACAETTELADLRRRVGIPVIADIGDRPELAAAAVAAGADGVWLSATAAAVSQAKEAVIRLTPLVRQVIPQTLTGCRDAIDGVDAVLATLLEYRVSLAGQVQRLKSVGGHAGRDPQREAAIVRGMAARASSLLPHHVERIVDVIIAAGLDVSERELLDGPPVWRM